MGKTGLISVVGLFLAVGVYTLSTNLETKVVPDVLAATGGSNVTAGCEAGSAQAFVPSLTTNIAASVSASAAPSFSASLSQTNPVTSANGADPAISVTTSLNSGYLEMSHQGPKMKLSGLECTNSSTATGEVANDDNVSAIDVKVGADDATGYGAMTAVNTTTKVAVWSASPAGLSLAADLEDGTANDEDGALNGEIAVGGTADNVDYSLGYRYDVTGNGNTSKSDIITWTFTPL